MPVYACQLVWGSETADGHKYVYMHVLSREKPRYSKQLATLLEFLPEILLASMLANVCGRCMC